MRALPPPIMAAQLTIGKSMDLRMANFMYALLTPAAGEGICISVTISSGARTVDPGTVISQNFSASINLLLVLILAFSATRAGAVSLGLTAKHILTAPKMEWYRLSPAMA